MILFAPDLRNGTIFNRIDSLNQWVTNIQSVLKLGSKQDSAQFFYLSHEFRNCSIVFDKDNDNQSIYQYYLQRNLESSFLTYSHNDRFYLTLGCDSKVDREQTQPITNSNKRLFTPFARNDWFSEVHCENVRVTPLSFEEVYRSCQTKNVSISDLYFKLENVDNLCNTVFTIFSPVRYLNFSNAAYPGIFKPYLQLISGDCLLPLPNGLPGPAALAVAIDVDDHIHHTEATFQVYDDIEDDNLMISPASLKYRGLFDFNSTVQFFRF